MIRRVFIKGYKSLQDIDLELKPLTVLIGPNASGKSNLLDALGLLSRIVTQGSIHDAFDEHRGVPLEAFNIGSGGLKASLAQESLRFTLGVEVDLSDKAVRKVKQQIEAIETAGKGLPEDATRDITYRRLRYALTVEFTTSSGTLRTVQEKLRALGDDGEELGGYSPTIDIDGDTGHMGDGQKSIIHFGRLPRGVLAATRVQPHLFPHIAAFQEELLQWHFHHLSPAAMRHDRPLKETSTLEYDGAGLASFFHTQKEISGKQFENTELSLRTLIPEVQDLFTVSTDDGFVRLMLREDGATLSARVVSDGTLRVLGLLAALSPNNEATVVGIEEPENGVHPRRLQILARLLENAALYQGKQVIVTTHSPKLPEYLESDYLDEEDSANISIVLCGKEDARTKFHPIADRFAFDRSLSNTTLEETLLRGDLEWR